MKKYISFILISYLLVNTSCEKDTNSTPASSVTQEIVNIRFSEGDFIPTDGKGVLGLTNTYSSIIIPFDTLDTLTSFYSAAAAIFYHSVNDEVFLNAGDVFLNQDTLYFFDSFSAYVNYHNMLYFKNGMHWKVTGNVFTGIPAIDYHLAPDTPYFAMWNGSQNYTKEDGISINFNGAFTNTDSLIAVVESETNPDNSYSKPFSPKATSLTFLDSELISIPTGPVRIRIRAFNYIPKTVNSKKYYFLLELERSINATLN